MTNPNIYPCGDCGTDTGHLLNRLNNGYGVMLCADCRKKPGADKLHYAYREGRKWLIRPLPTVVPNTDTKFRIRTHRNVMLNTGKGGQVRPKARQTH